MAKSMDSAANGGRGDDGEFRELTKRISKLMNQRYKHDPKKADTEVDKLINKLSKQMQKDSTTMLKAEGKSQAEIRKMQLEAAKEEAFIRLAAAETAAEKAEASAEVNAAIMKESANEMKDKLKSAALNFGAAMDGDIKAYAKMLGDYSGKINARLQGLDGNEKDHYTTITKLIQKNLAASPFVTQNAMFEKLNAAVEAGISYNVEQRAFLASVSENIAATFDAFDSNLLRIIRIQQADSTAARLGMEASLTKQLNNMFSDTYYMNSLYDTVSEALIETTATLGRNNSVGVEYTIQKWLGSMSAVGVSDSTIQNIAGALGMLGSGDIEGLASNEAMNKLLMMSANRAGVSYTGMLQNGLNANDVNRLMESMVSYIAEIGNTGNQVVKAQFGQVFGVTMSDMVSVMSLVDEGLSNITKHMLDYGGAIAETDHQLSQVGDRIYVSKLIDNVVENFKTGIAGNIAGNAASYVMYQVVDWVEQLTGGINIPAISVMGNMVDLDTTVTGLIKTGMVGVSVIGQVGKVLAGLGSKGGLNLDSWGGEEYLRRGTGFAGSVSGMSQGTSTSGYMGSSSGSDIQEQSIASASEEGNEKIENSQDDPDSTQAILKKILELLGGRDGNTATVYITNDYLPISISGTSPVIGDTVN